MRLYLLKYSAVPLKPCQFLQNTHNIQPIAHPWGLSSDWFWLCFSHCMGVWNTMNIIFMYVYSPDHIIQNGQGMVKYFATWKDDKVLLELHISITFMMHTIVISME